MIIELLTAAWLGAPPSHAATLLPERVYTSPAFLRVDPRYQMPSGYAYPSANPITWQDYSGAAIESDSLRPRYPGMWHTMAPEYGSGSEALMDMRSGVSGVSSGARRIGTQGIVRIGGESLLSNVGGKFYQHLAGYPDTASRAEFTDYYSRLYAHGALDDPVYPYERHADEQSLGEPFGGEVPGETVAVPKSVPEPPYPEPPPAEIAVETVDSISHRGDEPERGYSHIVFGEVISDPRVARIRDDLRRSKIANYQRRMLDMHDAADAVRDRTDTIQRRMIYGSLAVGSVIILGALAAGYAF